MNTKALFPLLHINFSTQVSFTNPYKNPKKKNGKQHWGRTSTGRVSDKHVPRATFTQNPVVQAYNPALRR